MATKETTAKTVKKETTADTVTKETRKEIILYDVAGKPVKEKDYFFKGEAPSYFTKISGVPVDREDMIAVFNKIFKPKYGFLFYKDKTKEVYLVIVPIKYSTQVGDDNDSVKGEFQKHAMSFINEGSVNLDTLKSKLLNIFDSGTIKIKD